MTWRPLVSFTIVGTRLWLRLRQPRKKEGVTDDGSYAADPAREQKHKGSKAERLTRREILLPKKVTRKILPNRVILPISNTKNANFFKGRKVK